MDYRLVPALNQSRLTLISNGILKPLNNKDDKPSKSLEVGTIVDLILSNQSEEIKEKYVFTDELKNLPEKQFEIFKEHIYGNVPLIDAVRKRYDINNKKSDDDLLQQYALNEEKGYKKYLDLLIKYKDKTILPKNWEDLSISTANTMMSHPFVKEYCKTENPENENIEYVYQLELYWEYKGVQCKGKIDKAVFNHEDKTIMPIDFKTSGDHVSKFKNSFYKFRYDIQADFYTFGLKTLYPEYKIEPFTFIVESTTYPGTPLPYKVLPSTLCKARYGYIRREKKYMGWEEAFERYRWHEENNLWDYPMEVYLNDNVGIICIGEE